MSNSLYYSSEEKQEKQEKQEKRETTPSLAEEVAELKGIVAKQTEQICSLLTELVAPIRFERRRTLRKATTEMIIDTGYSAEYVKRKEALRKKWRLELQALDALIAESKHSYGE